MFKATENFIYAMIACAAPFLIREFHKYSTPKKFGLVTTIWASTYAILMYQPYQYLDRYNRKIAQ